MPIGQDKQYDLSWEEQDKVRRRLEIKNRLKMEGVKKRFNPFRHLKAVPYTDPALDRYMDMRKKGRVPNAPLSPRIFYTLMAATFIPIWGLAKLMRWERKDFLKGCANGDIPYSERTGKAIA